MFRDLQRLRRITGIIGKYGYESFVRRATDGKDGIATGDFAVDPSTKPHAVPQGPRKFRLMLQELGPTFIKLGQVLSSRPDLISADYVKELKLLQDHCDPLPFADIERALREGLASPVSELFRSIEETPLATASIAQVHRGITADGDEVVVKVRRPGVADEVAADIEILYRVARLLDAVIEESRLAEPVGIVREFERGILEELNFFHEAANLAEFGKFHEAREDIVVPRVFPKLSSTTVLTMSYLAGTPLSRLGENVDKKAIAVRIVREAFDEVFLDGVFHADPHPGNLLLLDDGRYGLLDLGLLGRLTPMMKETLVVMALAIAMRDADTVARTLYRLGQSGDRVDISAVRDDVALMFQTYLDRSIRDVDPGLLLQQLLGLAMKHRIRVPTEYTMLARAGATIEGIVREFHPDIDVADVAKPYAERLLMGRVAPGNVEGGLYKALLQFQGLSRDVPLQLSQLLSDLSSGKFEVRISGRELERLRSSVLLAATTLCGAMVGSAFIIGAFLGLSRIDARLGGIPLDVAFAGFVGVGVLSWTIAYAFFRPRLKKISILRWLTKHSQRGQGGTGP